jgi:hypothetical protein
MRLLVAAQDYGNVGPQPADHDNGLILERTITDHFEGRLIRDTR